MITYRVDVRPILESVGASLDIADTLDIPEIVVGDEVFRLLEPATFSVAVSNAGAGIVAYGSTSARVQATCSRCLCEFEDTLEGEVVGFFVRPGDEPGQDEDDAGRVDDAGSIDIGPALSAALVIEAPFVPLHEPECAGLCSGCGADLNVEVCTCEACGDDDHPFAALKDLLEGDDTAE